MTTDEDGPVKVESEVPTQTQHTADKAEGDANTSAVIAAAAAAAVATAQVEDAAIAAALAVKTEDRHESGSKRKFDELDSLNSLGDDSKDPPVGHEALLAQRRKKDRERYAAMSEEQREAYNQKRREQYHRQADESRHRRRERERQRYHSLDDNATKERNARRAKLERERYQKLTAAELEEKNRKRRERAAKVRKSKKSGASSGISSHGVEERAAPSLDDSKPKPVETPSAEALADAVKEAGENSVEI